jgi:uncharacterized PurR-regulated membrane protein YhhQ (DUF165 family)
MQPIAANVLSGFVQCVKLVDVLSPMKLFVQSVRLSKLMRIGWMVVILYLSSILFANLLVIQFGIITHFGLTFPAGAYAIGLTFTFRDMVQRRYGKWKCWIWMGLASLITVWFSPEIALASVSAFLISEGVDWLVYTLVPGSFTKRVVLSNLIGTPLDSVVFVLLAFGPVWPAMWGQTIIKLVMGLLVLVAFKFIRKGG